MVLFTRWPEKYVLRNSEGGRDPSTKVKLPKSDQKKIRDRTLQGLDKIPYWVACKDFISCWKCAMSSAPTANVLLVHWWVCRFPSGLISQLWSLLSTIRQTQKESFSGSSALEIFLQTEKGSRKCHLFFSLFWTMVTKAEGPPVSIDLCDTE